MTTPTRVRSKIAVIAPSAAAVARLPVGHSECDTAPRSALVAPRISSLMGMKGASVQSHGEHIVVLLLSGQSHSGQVKLLCVGGSGQLFGGQVEAGFSHCVVTGGMEPVLQLHGGGRAVFGDVYWKF